MKRSLLLAWLIAVAALPLAGTAHAGHSEYDALVAAQAQANGVPEALVHRVILRESRYQPHLVGRCGCIGLMQIKLATARGLGYTGDAAGLRDPNTNLTYGVKYLAGAYRAAHGDQARAMHYYASGYYGVAKRARQARNIGDARAQVPAR
jgi:soluble lytic murein transglycosylase-like protein